MHVAITGGRGFIGSLLVERHLQRGDQVRMLTRDERFINKPVPANLDIFESDLTSGPDNLINFVDGIDVLYHCAGEINIEECMYSTHIDGTKNLLAAAKGRIGKWVQLSSSGVYGDQRDSTITEESKLNPIGTYEYTKMCSDGLLVKTATENQIPWFIIRPSTVYGSGMKNKSLFQLIKAIDRGIFFYIGRKQAIANYIHVDNVIEALLLCAYSSSNNYVDNVYNLSQDCLLQEFVNTISTYLGKKNPTLHLPEIPVRASVKLLEKIPGFPLTTSRINALTNRKRYSIDKITNCLGYKEKISIEEGLKKLVSEWKNWS